MAFEAFCYILLEMIVDRDACWSKSFWASIAEHLHLQVLLSTSHHPQHDGQMEHQNQTLEIALCAYIVGSKANWAKWLPTLALPTTPLLNHPWATLPFSSSMDTSPEAQLASP